MPGGVEHDPALFGVGLDGGRHGAEGEHPGLGAVEVVDAELEVGLLSVGGIGPGRGPVVSDSDEAESGCAVPAEEDEVVGGVQDGQV